MTIRSRAIPAVLIATALLLAARATAKVTFVEFDVPGSVQTDVSSLDDAGNVVGSYSGSDRVRHGYIRHSDGTFAYFNREAGEPFPLAVSSTGEVVGYIFDGEAYHGFVGALDGSISEVFDVKGATVQTDPQGLNGKGTIVGVSSDESYVFHGFVRNNRGHTKVFDAPGSGTETDSGTFPMSINKHGYIAGYYEDNVNARFGFWRAPNGDVTTFEIDGALAVSGGGTSVSCISDDNKLSGSYSDEYDVWHAYLRTLDGIVTTWDAPGAGTGFGQGTRGGPMNRKGDLAGVFSDSNSAWHGYLRRANGKIRTFDAPNAGAGHAQGTQVSMINNKGVIAGRVEDEDQISHGYLRFP